MSKIDNLKKAAFEVFGLGAETEQPTDAAFVDVTPVEAEVDAEPVKVVEDKPHKDKELVTASRKQTAVTSSTSAPYVLVPATYLAPGVVMEGTLRSKGDVEIAGTFKGDIISEGDVTLHTGLDGNVTANNLNVVDCTVTGDCNVTTLVKVDANSKISGTIVASELLCSGKIEGGDIRIRGNATFASTSVVDANITAGSIAMERGAKISGQLTMTE